MNGIFENWAVINSIYFSYRFLYHMIYFAVYGTQWNVKTKEFGCRALSDIGIFRYVFFKIIWSVLNARIISYLDRIVNCAIDCIQRLAFLVILFLVHSRGSYREAQAIRSFSSLYGAVSHDQKFIHFRHEHSRRHRAKVRYVCESERSRRSTCLAIASASGLIIHIRYTFSRESEDVTGESTASPGIEGSRTTKTRTIITSRRPYQT